MESQTDSVLTQRATFLDSSYLSSLLKSVFMVTVDSVVMDGHAPVDGLALFWLVSGPRFSKISAPEAGTY